MPITINDDDFPALNDDTLNLLQIVRSQAHLIKKITGKNSWLDYPDNNIQEILTELSAYGLLIDAINTQQNTINTNIATNTTNIANNTTAINAINAISRPRILWKTPQAQAHSVGTTATTLYSISIPAGTCDIDSILNLHMKFQAFNTTTGKTFSVVCNGITLSQFSLSQNTWYPYWKQISFNGSLSQPRTNGIAMGGFVSAVTTSINSFANFALDQTLTIRCSATTAETAIFIESGYLELI